MEKGKRVFRTIGTGINLRALELHVVSELTIRHIQLKIRRGAMTVSSLTFLTLLLSFTKAPAKSGTSSLFPSKLDLPCAKQDHPDDCALIQDIANEARSQCGQGQEFYNSWLGYSSVCDVPGVYCPQNSQRRIKELVVDMLADKRIGGNVFLCKSATTHEPQIPNGKSPFVVPQISLKRVSRTLQKITFSGITDICNLQDLADLESLKVLEVFATDAQLCKSRVKFPLFKENTSRLYSVRFSNINFKGSVLPSKITHTLTSFECTNCSLSGKLPRKLISSLGCDRYSLQEAVGGDQGLASKCDNYTATCPREVCDEYAYKTSEVLFDAPSAHVKLRGNSFEDILQFEDIVRCSSGLPGLQFYEARLKANQVVCDFTGSNISLPKEPWKPDIYVIQDLFMSNIGVTGTLPDWLFDPKHFTWTAIDLSHNDFHGVIPSSITQMDQATCVLLHNNRFSGNIPDFSKMRSIGQSSSSTDIPYALTLNQNSFESTSIPFALFTACNWLAVDTLEPYMTCNFIDDYHSPSNSFSIPSPDEKACREGFGGGVKILGFAEMNLHTHLRDLLYLVKQCYPSLEELYSNVGRTSGYTIPGINTWIHGPFPDDQEKYLPKSMRVLDLFGTHISGFLPSAEAIGQLDTFNVENTTINGPIPDDWTSKKVIAENFVDPLSKYCTTNPSSSGDCETSMAHGLAHGWWLPLTMPQEIPQNLFLAYWEQCHAPIAPNAAMCEYFPVPFMRSSERGIIRSRLPTGKFSHAANPNPKVTKVGRFGDFFAGALPQEFVAAMSSALPKVKSLDFSSWQRYSKNTFLKGNIPNNFWSKFPQLETANFGHLRVPKSLDSKAGPNKKRNLKKLVFSGVFTGEAPLSLIRACGRKDLECGFDVEESLDCNHTYKLPDNLEPISDMTRFDLSGYFICENGTSFTRKMRQLSKIKTLIITGQLIVLERAAVASLHELQSLNTSAVTFERGISLNDFLLALKGKNMTDIVIPNLANYPTQQFDRGVLLPSLLTGFTWLRQLDLRYGSSMVDAGDFLLSACRAWKDLQVLQLDGNMMAGYIPECLSNMSSLKVLGLGSYGSSSISGVVPNQLGRRCVSTKSDHIDCKLCPNRDLPWCK